MGGAQGRVHAQTRLSALPELPYPDQKHKSVLKLACSVAHGLHVQVGRAGSRRLS